MPEGSIFTSIMLVVTFAMMVLTYSITKGIGIGVISYVLIYLVCYVIDAIKYLCAKDKFSVAKPKWKLSVVILVVFVLFVVYFIVPTVL